ncbi:hypothetical protein GGR58DRAFT_505465 [Xylaria digitata]|nr:hypothetical protein GGR58DRAFT_505465 [Xylaria digitata]
MREPKTSLPKELPDEVAVWCENAKERRVERLSIHDRDAFTGDGVLNSASKMNFRQYLLLRVIAPQAKLAFEIYNRQYRYSWIGIRDFDSAVKVLDTQRVWKLYLKSTKQGTKTGTTILGLFSFVRHYQLEVMKTDGESSLSAPLKIEIDYTSRTRQRAAQSQQLVTPIRPRSGRLSLESYTEPSPAVSTPERPESLSPESVYEESTSYKAAGDEQIVSTALILYLNALAFCCTRTPGNWTPRRKAFVVRSHGKKLYEARVDGYLYSHDNKVEAIVEVKPYARRSNRVRIGMQEAAQIAAWIASDPPDRHAETEYSRVLVSQDHNEIYIIIAKFDADYVDYICGNSFETTSFLNMQAYGPFRTDDFKHMCSLGNLLLAFMINRQETYLEREKQRRHEQPMVAEDDAESEWE